MAHKSGRKGYKSRPGHRKGKGKKKVAVVMGEFKRGKLRSSSGAKVMKRSQATAIGLSEARFMEAHMSNKKKGKKRKK